jgi:prepilin-type N-terminal cleavage/methylation domain-containing protein
MQGMTGRASRSKRAQGFTLIELMVALAVFVLGVLGFTRTMVAMERAQLAARESARATQAARTILERIQAEAFPEAFRRYNGSGADDPGGVNTAPGKNFEVQGLSARPGDPDGMPGEVLFPSPDGQPLVLSESVVDARWGMPRDLNGDGVVTAGANYATEYSLLPVRVRVEWLSAAGPCQVQIETLLGNY